MHRIKPKGGNNVRIVVMSNVFQTNVKIHEKYDLKGSIIGRMASEEEKQSPNPILKDLDVSKHVYLGKAKTKLLLDQLKSDAKFLESNQIMDYSLLLGVHDRKKKTPFCKYDSDDEEENKQYIDFKTETDLLSSKVLLDSPVPSTSLNTSINSPMEPIISSTTTTTTTTTTTNPAGSFLTRKPSTKTGTPTLTPNSHKLFALQQDSGGCASCSMDPGKIYFIGIIDILQKYDARKRFEQFFKSLRYDMDSISVAEPHLYAQRFVDFLSKVFVDHEKVKPIL